MTTENNKFSDEYPLVTIGVASYNNGRFIRETLDSIKSQSYPNIEVIIHDDCSIDNSLEVINKWISENDNENNKLLLSSTNIGLCASLNKIVKIANGKYISLIGSDDRYLPDFVSTRINTFKLCSFDTGMIYSKTFQIDETKGINIGIDNRDNWPSGYIYEEILSYKNSFCKPLTTMIKKDVYENIGMYDESLIFEDLDFFLRLAKIYKILYIEDIQTEYRIVKGSLGTKLLNERGLNDKIKILQKHLYYKKEIDLIIFKRLQKLVIEGYKNGIKIKNFKTILYKPFNIAYLIILLLKKLKVHYNIILRTKKCLRFLLKV